MTSVWDQSLANKYDGGDDYCIINNNLYVNRVILVTKHTFTQTDKG